MSKTKKTEIRKDEVATETAVETIPVPEHPAKIEKTEVAAVAHVTQEIVNARFAKELTALK